MKIWSSASALPLCLACEYLKFRFRTSALLGLWRSLKFLFRTSAQPGVWRSEDPLPRFRSTGPVKIWSSASALPLILAHEDWRYTSAEVPLSHPLYLAGEDLKFRFRNSALGPVKIWSSASAQPGPWKSEVPLPHFCSTWLACENLKFSFRTSVLPGLWKSEITLPPFRSTWPVKFRFAHPLLVTWPVKIWSSASALPLYLACKDIRSSASVFPLNLANDDLKFQLRSTGHSKIWSSTSAFPLDRACEDLKFRFRTFALINLACEDLKFRFRTSALPCLWRSEVPLPPFRSIWPLKIWSSASAIPLYPAFEALCIHTI